MGLMLNDVPSLRPDDYRDRALELFVESDRMDLAVATPDYDRIVIGIGRRADISGAYLRRVHGIPPSMGSGGDPGIG